MGETLAEATIRILNEMIEQAEREKWETPPDPPPNIAPWDSDKTGPSPHCKRCNHSMWGGDRCPCCFENGEIEL